MSKNRIFVLVLIMITSSFLRAQQDEARYVIHRFFEAFNAPDTAQVQEFLTDNFKLTTLIDGEKRTIGSSALLNSIARNHNTAAKEDYYISSVKMEEGVAFVSTPYQYYLSDTLHHCGINEFFLIKKGRNWRIASIVYNHRSQGCNESIEKEVKEFLDKWHLAATMADEERFFGSMAKDGVYIGTDPGEHWYRDELREWAKGAFEEAPAWDFKVKERYLMVGNTPDIVWFDELLDTWMGVCRGSGVLKIEDGIWKIQQYVLSVTVPNEQIEAFRKLTDSND